jgi:hypothetical protein
MTNTSKETALKLLKEYSCIQIKQAESETEKENLRQAIKLITSLSEYENIGICADNYQQGFLALSSYLKALGYEANLNLDSLPKGEDSVYIKFNTQKMNYYLDSYTGTYRGVLISCQGEDDSIVGTYGHFPLDLFSN